jgi:hypothetical protein
MQEKSDTLPPVILIIFNGLQFAKKKNKKTLPKRIEKIGSSPNRAGE